MYRTSGGSQSGYLRFVLLRQSVSERTADLAKVTVVTRGASLYVLRQFDTSFTNNGMHEDRAKYSHVEV
jgi:hypothetical protein